MLRSALTLLAFFTATACLTQVDPAPQERALPGVDATDEGEGEVAAEGEGEGEGEGEPELVDDAVIVAATFPPALACSEASTASVTVQNTGTSTWTAADGFKLGAVDDGDPLAADRVTLSDGDVVLPGETHAFTVVLTAPALAQSVTSDWRMVHESVRWFGAATTHHVSVACDPLPAEFDLSQAIIENSPNVASWPVTTTITALDLQANGVHVDFTKKDGAESWPDVPFGAPGDSLEYTLWIVINIDGQWYASGCIEYWRGLDRNGGPPSEYAANWYYDAIRWGPMVGHQPAPREQVGFLVTAGDARNNGDALVQERSNVVFVPFPTDDGAVFP